MEKPTNYIYISLCWLSTLFLIPIIHATSRERTILGPDWVGIFKTDSSKHFVQSLFRKDQAAFLLPTSPVQKYGFSIFRIFSSLISKLREGGCITCRSSAAQSRTTSLSIVLPYYQLTSLIISKWTGGSLINSAQRHSNGGSSRLGRQLLGVIAIARHTSTLENRPSNYTYSRNIIYFLDSSIDTPPINLFPTKKSEGKKPAFSLYIFKLSVKLLHSMDAFSTTTLFSFHLMQHRYQHAVYSLFHGFPFPLLRMDWAPLSDKTRSRQESHDTSCSIMTSFSFHLGLESLPGFPPPLTLAF